MSDYVWYASYGSNFYSKRLELYLKGGSIPGLTREHPGSRDATPPKKSAIIEIPYPTFFSQKATSWENKGVAFLDAHSSEKMSLSRIYLVTREQFVDIFTQENGLTPGSLKYEPDMSLQPGEHSDIGPDDELQWYGKVIALDTFEGKPVFTFTCKSEEFAEEKNKPGTNYLAVIAKGLMETGISEYDAIHYLQSIPPLEGQDTATLNQAVAIAHTLE